MAEQIAIDLPVANLQDINALIAVDPDGNAKRVLKNKIPPADLGELVVLFENLTPETGNVVLENQDDYRFYIFIGKDSIYDSSNLLTKYMLKKLEYGFIQVLFYNNTYSNITNRVWDGENLASFNCNNKGIKAVYGIK